MLQGNESYLSFQIPPITICFACEQVLRIWDFVFKENNKTNKHL